jgi:hypothetical protein
MVARIEGGRLEDDLKQLPCVARFCDEARRLLGEETYNTIAMSSIDLEGEQTGPSQGEDQ